MYIMKIGIVMYYDSKIKNYGEINYKINKNIAKNII